MSTSPENERDYLDIEGEFSQAHSIVSCISDLLTPAQQNESWNFDANTMPNIGEIYFDQAVKMKSLFDEVLDLYLAERKADKQ
jgi:hypothetical protein